MMLSRQLGKSLWAALQIAALGASPIWAPLVRIPSVDIVRHAQHRGRRTVAGERRAAAKRLAVRRERARRKAGARR